MLPKKKRITKKIFQSVLKERKTLSTSLFLFYFKNSNSPQYAFVSPKGVFKKTHQRNKFRRIGYNILRYLPINKGIGVFFFKKQAPLANQEEIKNNIIFLLKKAGFLEKNL